MNKNIEKIYGNMPIWMQNIMIGVYGRRLKKERYSKIYHEELERLKQRDVTDPGKMNELQNKMFLDFIHFAVENSPFYKEFYKDVDLSKIKSVDDIGLLPILDKETLRQNIEQIRALPKEQCLISITGGTTGKSLKVYFSKEDSQKRMAYLDWYKWIHGFEMCKNSSARFNGKNIIPSGQKSKVFWRDNSCMKQRIYSTFFTSPANIPYYVENLNRLKPEEMDGFCSSMYEIAKYMDANNVKAEFTPKAIFPTSETVLPVHREMLSKVFGCPVRDQYASSEGAPFIIECPDGHMHECIDTGVFEHIPTDKGTKLLVTAFHTHGTPLIRYDIGDDIIEDDHLYETGCYLSGFPIIKAIDGRAADCLYSPERGIISIANLSNVIKYLPNSIKNIQYVQNNTEEIEIKMVVDDNLYDSSQEKEILQEMRNRFGDKMRFTITIVDEIPRAASGKYKMIINNLEMK